MMIIIIVNNVRPFSIAMSFLIDDILRKNDKTKDGDKGVRRDGRCDDEQCSSACCSYPASILQQTLMNSGGRVQQCDVSYRRLGEQYPKMFIDTSWSRVYDKYPSPNCCDLYAGAGMTCGPSYMRPRGWSLPVYLPHQYPYSYFSKRKGGQVRFTTNQTDVLEQRFVSHKYLSPEDRRTLADSLKLTDRQVKTWFQNRRAKWRRSNSVDSTTSNESSTNPQPHTPQPLNSS